MAMAATTNLYSSVVIYPGGKMAMAATNTVQSSQVSRNSPRLPAITGSKLFSLRRTPHTSLHFLHKKAFTLHLSSSTKLKTISSKPIRAIASQSSDGPIKRVFHGKCFVLNDNIDTDQIIPAEYCTLVSTNPEEYEKLGSCALIGLPGKHKKFIEEGETKTQYPIVIAGANFGCGSSREHAPVALGAAGARVVVAESYARIFFRNSVSTGEVHPVESECRICEECETGHIVSVELEGNKLINHTTGKEYALKPIGDAGPVIDAGGIFAYARKTGMIASSPTA